MSPCSSEAFLIGPPWSFAIGGAATLMLAILGFGFRWRSVLAAGAVHVIASCLLAYGPEGRAGELVRLGLAALYLAGVCIGVKTRFDQPGIRNSRKYNPRHWRPWPIRW